MNLHAFDIPDAPAELPAWLEQHLVGTDLRALAAELGAVHEGSPGSATIDELLGPARSDVLNRGLAALPREKLQALLRQPAQLLELQELVLSGGGEYWQQLAARGPVAEAVRGLRAGALPAKSPSTTVAQSASGGTRPHGAWYQHPLVVSLTTAALMLAAFFLSNESRQPPAAPTPWGWNRPGALAATATREAYLTGLADAADEWFKKPPADAKALATRMTQFRAGCSTLILADHAPLGAEDKTWLTDKCRAWAAKIDGHLTTLEAGGKVEDVRAAMDDTVRKLATAIRDRAKS